MKQIHERPVTAGSPQDRSASDDGPASPRIALWQVNLLRAGYVLMAGGIAVFKWPLFFEHRTWGLAEGTVQCMLVAMSVLALLGIRYPVRLLPILLFEVAWKLLWLGVIAVPLWSQAKLQGATLDQTGRILWVVPIIAVIPWRYAFTQYVTARGDTWRGTRQERVGIAADSAHS